MKDRNQKIQEMHALEQNIHNIVMQKQAFQMELSETKSALKEIEKSGDDIFKIIGQLMIKKDKSEIKKELENKEKLLDMRIKSFDTQENNLSEKLEKLREDAIKDVK